MSQNDLSDSQEKSATRSKYPKASTSTGSKDREKDFVTHFPKTKSLLKQYGPSFLPPIRKEAMNKYNKLEVIVEKDTTEVKGLKKHTESVHMISAL